MSPARKLQKRRWFAVASAVGAYMLLLWLPIYGGVSETVRSDGTRTRASSGATLADVNGRTAYLIIAVPLFAALLTIVPLPTKFRRFADIVGATIATAFVILGLWTIGAFFLPTAVALVATAAGNQPTAR